MEDKVSERKIEMNIKVIMTRWINEFEKWTKEKPDSYLKKKTIIK